MDTGANEGVPEYKIDPDHHARQAYNRLSDVDHAVAYLNNLEIHLQQSRSWIAFSEFQKTLTDGINRYSNQRSSQLEPYLRRGGLVGIDIVTTMLGASSTDKIADCIEWSYARIRHEVITDTREEPLSSEETLIGELLDYGLLTHDRYNDSFIDLAGDIHQLLTIDASDETSDIEAERNYLEAGMGFVLNSVRDYADVWDYLNTDNDSERHDHTCNRLLFDV